MKKGILIWFMTAAVTFTAGAIEPVKSVEIGKNAELRVNGKPFFPLMLWLQNLDRIPDGQSIAVNTFAAKEGELSDKEFLDKLNAAGMYGILEVTKDTASIKAAAAHPSFLGWIQGDEPDMATPVSDAVVEPGPGMNPNPSTPFSRIVDGESSSWTVLEPLEGGQFTLKLKNPVTVQNLSVWLTISAGLPVARDVVFEADGKEIAKVTFENKSGEQKVVLKEPVTFKNLTMKVLTSYRSDKQEWGSIGELAGYDKDGKNVLETRPRIMPRTPVDQLRASYKIMKETDPSHPVLMTFTADFMKGSGKYTQAEKDGIYPEYSKCADMVGFDIYPIFGSGTPNKLQDVADSMTQLKAIVGAGKPVYQWIETNKGSQWMDLSKQLEVTPRDTRAEVWMSIIRGATGIGYFTHRWRPDYRQFALEPDMVREVKRLNEQITRLAPAILAGPAKAKIEMKLAGEGDAGSLTCHFKATALDGSLHIFAQNIDVGKDAGKLQQFDPIKPRGGKATIAVEGLKPGTRIEVMDENRVISSADSFFTDDFAPLAEHIYRLKL